MIAALALLALQVPPQVPSTQVAQKGDGNRWEATVNVPRLNLTASGRALVGAATNDGKSAMNTWIAQTRQSLKTFTPPGQLQFEIIPASSYEKGNVASAVQLVFDYSGGAHPNTGYTFYNYWNSQPIKLARFFAPGFDANRHVSYLLLEKLVNNPQANWVQDGTVRELTAAQMEHFQVKPGGIAWTFAPYELGPYVSGTVIQFLSADQLGPMFRRGMLLGQ